MHILYLSQWIDSMDLPQGLLSWCSPPTSAVSWAPWPPPLTRCRPQNVGTAVRWLGPRLGEPPSYGLKFQIHQYKSPTKIDSIILLVLNVGNGRNDLIHKHFHHPATPIFPTFSTRELMWGFKILRKIWILDVFLNIDPDYRKRSLILKAKAHIGDEIVNIRTFDDWNPQDFCLCAYSRGFNMFQFIWWKFIIKSGLESIKWRFMPFFPFSKSPTKSQTYFLR